MRSSVDSTQGLAARLRAAMELRGGMGVMELAEKSGISRNTVGEHLDGTTGRVPHAKTLRAYEKALRLDDMSLNAGTPGELVTRHQKAPQRGSGPEPAPLQPYRADARSLERAANFVLEQFAIYRRASLPIPPQIVAVLASELEAAMGRGEGSSGSPPGSAESGTLGGG